MPIDFFESGLCFYCHLAKNELNEYFYFHSETEVYWEKKDDELQKKLKVVLSKYPEKYRRDVVESHSWDLHLNQIRYPDIHRESLILAIYSYFENQLNRLCDILSESVENNVSLRDLKGQGIERAFLYLKKIAGFNLSDLGKEMSYIRNVNKIRNIIVHNGAMLPEDLHPKILKFISDNLHLYGEAGMRITIRSEFINEYLEKLIQFYEILGKEVEKYIQKFDNGRLNY